MKRNALKKLRPWVVGFFLTTVANAAVIPNLVCEKTKTAHWGASLRHVELTFDKSEFVNRLDYKGAYPLVYNDFGKIEDLNVTGNVVKFTLVSANYPDGRVTGSVDLDTKTLNVTPRSASDWPNNYITSLQCSMPRAPAQHVHAKHNMILFGTEEIFADHIVYKTPHNYQVILQVRFDDQAKRDYLSARLAHPQDTLILLLDPLDISQISTLSTLTGTILRRDASDQETVIAQNVRLERDEFKVIFFSELPLSLGADQLKRSFPWNLPDRLSTKLEFSLKGKDDCPYARKGCRFQCQHTSDPEQCYVDCVAHEGC